MKDYLDLRTDRERFHDRTSNISKLIVLIVIFVAGLFLFSGCMGMGSTTDTADDRYDAVQDLGHLSGDVVRDARYVKRILTRVSYHADVVNRSCSSYYGQDESGNEFRIPAGKITPIKVQSDRRGDPYVSVMFSRINDGEDCNSRSVYSGEIDRNHEEITLQ